MNKYDTLSTRAGFNTVVRHVKGTISMVENVSDKNNFGDALSSGEFGADLAGEQLAAMLRMILVDKMGYVAVSRNLSSAADNLESVAEEISKWNAVDIVVAYHHPDLGLCVANPKSAAQLAAFGVLRKREAAVAYVGKFSKGSDALCVAAANLALDLLEGNKAKIPAELLKGEFAYKSPKAAKLAKAPKPAKGKAAATEPAAKRGRKPKAEAVAPAPVAVAAPVRAAAPVAAAPLPTAAPVVSGPKPGSRMTPMYSVVVQNELFHNGNVEAWKRIIASYKAKYPTFEVFIYYDGERIVDINSLFKWGKVKHGSTIQFAVAGVEIKDVAKLQRYLNQGASHQFEAFLHGPVSTVLKLF